MSREEALQTLVAAGMPQAVVVGAGRFAADEVGEAVAAFRGHPLDEAPFLAWLWALRSYWPQRFAMMGLEADFLDAKQRCRDWNRVIKLRRIAIERLAEMI